MTLARPRVPLLAWLAAASMLVALPQARCQYFGSSNASRIQGKPVQNPLNCTDAFVITWVTANNRFECKASAGGGGIVPTGTPSVGWVPTATSSSAATWQAPAAGGAAITRGLFASAPSCTSSSFLYLATDYPGLFHCNGSSSSQWFLNWGPNVTPAANVSFTGWINQSTASVATVGGSVILTGVAAGGTTVNMRYLSLPVAPYSVTACFATANAPVNSWDAGIFIADGTNASTSKIITFSPNSSGSSTAVIAGPYKWTNSSSFSAAYAGVGLTYTGTQPKCMTISDNGTTRKFWTSFDGVTRVLNFSVGNTDFLTPTLYGIFTNSNNSSVAPILTVWSLTALAETI